MLGATTSARSCRSIHSSASNDPKPSMISISRSSTSASVPRMNSSLGRPSTVDRLPRNVILRTGPRAAACSAIARQSTCTPFRVSSRPKKTRCSNGPAWVRRSAVPSVEPSKQYGTTVANSSIRQCSCAQSDMCCDGALT